MKLLVGMAVSVLAVLLASAAAANFEAVRFELEINEGLQSPMDVAVADDGSILVLDAKSLSITRYSEQGKALTTFGSKALFQKPTALAVAPDGSIAVADQRAKMVLILDAQGNVVTRIGGPGSGAGQFNKLVDIAFDHFGFLYTSDAGSKRVAQFTAQGVLLSEMSFPHIVPDALSVDRSGRINLLLSGGAEVYRFKAGENLSKLQRVRFNPTPSGAGGLFVDNYGDLYITRSGKNNVQKFDSAGALVASFGSRGKSRGAFSGPTRVAGDSDGRVFIVDSKNRRIQGFAIESSSNQPLQKLASSGPSVSLSGVESVADAVDDLGFAGLDKQYRLFGASGRVLVKGLDSTVLGGSGKKRGQFRGPRGAAALGADRYVVADTGNHRIQILDTNGKAIVIGERGKEPGFFNMPSDVAVNSESMIYVADTKNARVQIFTEQGIYVHSFGRAGKKPNDGVAPLEEFVNPVSIVIGGNNEVHVLDTTLGRVVSFDGRGTPLRSLEGLVAPADIAIDRQQNLYVAANGCNCVKVFDPSGNALLRFGGAGLGGGQLASITALAVAGNAVLVADSGSSGADLSTALLGLATGKNKNSGGGIKTFDVALTGIVVEDRVFAEHSFFVNEATRSDEKLLSRHRAAALEALVQKLADETGLSYAQAKNGMRLDSENSNPDGSIALRGSIPAPAAADSPAIALPASEEPADVIGTDEVELAF